MYEEDRQKALAMYNRLFDEVGDEQGLLQLLVSPTRQAVVIARSYNAKERKLQVHAQSREEAGDEQGAESPQFVSVIEGIRAEALSRQPQKPAEVSADQFSMFEEDFFAPTPEKPAAEPETEAPAESTAEADAAEAQPEEEKPQEDTGAAAEPAPQAEAETEPKEEAAEAQPEQTKADGGEQDAVDAFLADFEIVDHDEAEQAEQPQTVEAQPEMDGDTAESGEEPAEADDEQDYDYDYDEDEDGVYFVRKPRVFLLILYILLAIPVGLLGIIILILPTLLFLVLAAGFVSTGIVAVTTAFGGLPLFADIIVAIGAAFILLALGLLSLWTAIWFVGGAMVGLVKGLIHLGGRWCYKEVEA